MFSKQTYTNFFLRENYDTKPKKKKTSSHAQSACDEVSYNII